MATYGSLNYTAADFAAGQNPSQLSPTASGYNATWTPSTPAGTSGTATLPTGQTVSLDTSGNVLTSSGSVFTGGGLPLTGTLAALVPGKVTTSNAPEGTLAGVKLIAPDLIPAPDSLQAKGIYGAVRVGDSPNVFTVGPNGGWETAASYLKKFGTSNQAGIVSNITSDQAVALGINPTSIVAPPSSNPNITAQSLSNVNSYDLSGVNTGNTSAADKTIASANATAQGLQKYIDLLTPPDTSTKTSLDSLMAQYMTDLGTSGGRGAAQAAADEAQGVQAKKEALTTVQNQILTKTAESTALDASYQQQNQSLEGTQTTLSRLQGSQAQNYKMYLAQKNSLASEVGLLQAQALGLTNQYNDAVNAANRSVDLKYADITDHLNAEAKMIALVQGQLTKQETIRSDAMKLYLQDQQNALAVQVANEKDLNSTLLNQMQTYPDAGITMSDTLDQANAKITKNSKIYQDKVRGPVGAVSQKWSDPYVLNGKSVQKNLTTGEIKNIGDVGNDTNALITHLQETGLPVNAVTSTGDLTKGVRDTILNAGVHANDVDIIWQAFQGNHTLDEIRQAIKSQGEDPGILDTFIEAMKKGSTITFG